MKTDKKLGLEVGEHLKNVGVETPMNPAGMHMDAPAIIERKFYEIMAAMGLSMNDDSLRDTPKRVAKMYIYEIFNGLNYDNFPKCTTVENKMKYDEMVCIDKINVQSNCEHHFVIIDGLAKVAYIPKDKVLGLSKINRVVEFFSKRPQIQERLTEQIYHALSFILGTDDIAVQIKATHYCVKSRGVTDQNSDTTTSKVGGCFKEPTVRNEFLNL
jgi:GTP cyclohydrolase I